MNPRMAVLAGLLRSGAVPGVAAALFAVPRASLAPRVTMGVVDGRLVVLGRRRYGVVPDAPDAD